MFQKWMKVLIKSAIFKDIREEELEVMLNCISPRVQSFDKNECIALAGQKFEGIGIVLCGSVNITKENAAGNRIIISIVNEGEMFGEMAAYSGTKVWPATVITQEASTILILPPDKIVGECEKLCVSHKKLIINMLSIISNKALMLNKKVEYFTIKSMRGKISNFLLEQYNKTGKLTFMMPMKRNEFADFLNVSRPSLSREMCRMRDEGIIDFYKSSVQIKDIEALKASTQ